MSDIVDDLDCFMIEDNDDGVTVRRASAEITRLRALVAEMRDALHPFAVRAKLIAQLGGPPWRDDAPLGNFELGSCRRALAAQAKADEVLK